MQPEFEIKIAVAQSLRMENGKEISYGGGKMQSFRFNPLESSVETKDQIIA